MDENLVSQLKFKKKLKTKFFKKVKIYKFALISKTVRDRLIVFYIIFHLIGYIRMPLSFYREMGRSSPRLIINMAH